MSEDRRRTLRELRINLVGSEGSLWGSIIGALLDREHAPDEIGEFVENLCDPKRAADVPTVTLEGCEAQVLGVLTRTLLARRHSAVIVGTYARRLAELLLHIVGTKAGQDLIRSADRAVEGDQ